MSRKLCTSKSVLSVTEELRRSLLRVMLSRFVWRVQVVRLNNV